MTTAWIRTASGAKFDYELGADNEVNIFDIAEHLSKLPRFCGACRPNLTVAQHSVHVSVLMERDGGGPLHGLIGLLHDGHEAFMGDIPTPFTDHVFDVIGEDFKGRITPGIDEAIFKKAGIPYPLDKDVADKLHRCDKAAFAAEGIQLVRGFKVPEGCPTMDLGKINPVGQEQAYRMFLERYQRLNVARQRTRAA